MTYEEAKYWFNHNGASVEQEVEMRILINIALGKQDAKKPIYEDGYYCCAKCGERLETYLYSRSITYCSSCGKAHDWREVK